MRWRYQVVRVKTSWTDSGYVFGVHEAYLNDKGEITSISEHPVSLAEQTVADLLETLQKIREDIKDNGIVDYHDI